jgi:hypothetical protein
MGAKLQKMGVRSHVRCSVRLTCPAVVPAGTKADARGPTTTAETLGDSRSLVL